MIDASDEHQADGRRLFPKSELARAAHLNTAGETVAVLAHELNQTLARVTLNCEAALLLQRSGDGRGSELTEALIGAVEAARDANGVIGRLGGLLSELERERSIVAMRCARLTERERQVMRLVISDLSSKEIAQRLMISPRTVEHHREHVMVKMEARSVADLVTMAVLCDIDGLNFRPHLPQRSSLL